MVVEGKASKRARRVCAERFLEVERRRGIDRMNLSLDSIAISQ
jgi:hypothetical protein